MSDVEWDAEEFNAEVEPEEKPLATDKWVGEDEDDELKDNWDDDEGESKENNDENLPVQKKKKKSLKDIIAEKEEKKRQEMEERRKREEEERRKRTPEELLEEKIRQQKLQEDNDLEELKDLLGTGIPNNSIVAGKIDSCDPILKEDFDQFGEMLREKITKFQRSINYVGFLETLYRDLCVGLEVEDVKKLSSSLTALYNEKNKVQKSAKAKKKGKTKQSLNPGKDDNYDDYQTGAYDDLDDFM